MRNYRFKLWLAVDEREYDDWNDALYEAGGDDSSPGEIDGKPFAIFNRDACTLEDAIRSARETVQKAGLRVLSCEIEEDALAAAWPA